MRFDNDFRKSLCGCNRQDVTELTPEDRGGSNSAIFRGLIVPVSSSTPDFLSYSILLFAGRIGWFYGLAKSITRSEPDERITSFLPKKEGGNLRFKIKSSFDLQIVGMITFKQLID